MLIRARVKACTVNARREYRDTPVHQEFPDCFQIFMSGFKVKLSVTERAQS